MNAESKRHPDDYTALFNWSAHDQVRDGEITNLVLRLADHGMRLDDIENLMIQPLLARLALLEGRAEGPSQV